MFNLVKKRFAQVWNSNYPRFYYWIDLIISWFITIAFLTFNDYAQNLEIGLFFGIWPLAFLLTWAFSFGIVKARKGWSKKRT